MSTLRYLAIDPERLDAMRRRGADEFGNPWKPPGGRGLGAAALLPAHRGRGGRHRPDQLQPVAGALGHAVGGGGAGVRVLPPVLGLPDPRRVPAGPARPVQPPQPVRPNRRACLPAPVARRTLTVHSDTIM